MKIKVMLVEDSATVRFLLRMILEDDGRFEVVNESVTAEKALAALPEARPDVISLDIRLPGMDGLEATRQIMTSHPTPIVVVSACFNEEDSQVSMQALRAGALAVSAKPVGPGRPDHEKLARQFCNQLAIMSQVPVVRQWRRATAAELPRPKLPPWNGHPEVLGLVASTGGPNALCEVLRAIGVVDVPVLVVQHITDSFSEPFARWLAQVTRLEVEVARDGTRPAAGRIYLAPTGSHLELIGGVLRLSDGPMECGQKPSGNVLLRSLAAPNAVGVVLTGMGADGAEGLLEMARAGAYTLVESEETAVVSGMPLAAWERGAAREKLALPELGRRLSALLGN